MDAGSRTSVHARAFALSTAAGIAVTGLWVGMSVATSLIWHFHPALPGVAAGWGMRRGLGRPGGWSEAGATTAIAAVLTAAGGVVIRGADKALDDPWFIALVAAGGLAIGLWILLRPSERSV